MLAVINSYNSLVNRIQKCVFLSILAAKVGHMSHIYPDFSAPADCIWHKLCSLLSVFICSIRFDTQTGTLDCDLWPPRSASWQADPGSRAENPASPERRQHHRWGPSPEQPHVSRAQGLPRTAAGGAARRIVVGHLVAQLEGLQRDGAAAELAQAQGGGDTTQEAAREDERGEDKEGAVARHVCLRDGGTRAGRERAGLAGHLLTHRLWRDVKGEGDSAAHSRAIQVLVRRWGQTGPLAQEAQEQTGLQGADDEKLADVQKRRR